MTRPSSHWIVLLTLLPLLVVSLLVGCGGSTDTGNPPFVDESEIRITPSGDVVRVSGSSGAAPAGAGVDVENLSSGASGTTTAGDDGSFEVTLAGSAADDYRVVVTSEGRSSSITLSGTAGLADALLDRSFMLESADGYTPVPGTTITVSFDDEGFGFSGSCNSHFGPYTLCDGKLCIEGLGSTAIGCDAALSGQDEWLADFFTSDPQIVLEGDTLTFIGAEATLVFLDREVANPDRPLTGRVWTVDTVIDGGAASNLPTGEPATLDFRDDGTLYVFSGCNEMELSYEVTGAEITPSFVNTTSADCSGTTAGTLESHVSAVLTGTVTFEIEAQRLTLMNGTIGLGAMTD